MVLSIQDVFKNTSYPPNSASAGSSRVALTTAAQAKLVFNMTTTHPREHYAPEHALASIGLSHDTLSSHRATCSMDDVAYDIFHAWNETLAHPIFHSTLHVASRSALEPIRASNVYFACRMTRFMIRVSRISGLGLGNVYNESQMTRSTRNMAAKPDVFPVPRTAESIIRRQSRTTLLLPV